MANSRGLIPPHGGYRELMSGVLIAQQAEGPAGDDAIAIPAS